MKYLLALFLFLLYFKCYSQSFFSEINVAENYIIHGDYARALDKYLIISNKYQKLSYREYHNLLICCIKENEYNRVPFLLKKLIKLGYTIEDIEKFHLSSATRSNQLDSFLNNYNNLREKYLQSIDTSYRKKLYQIISKDKIAATSSNVRFQDSIYYDQTVKIINFINKNGFPSSFLHKDTLMPKLIGVFRHSFGLMHRRQSMKNLNTFYANMDFKRHNLEKVLLEAIDEHVFPPYFYLITYNYSEPGNKFGVINLMVDFKSEEVKLINLPKSKISEANFKRRQIGLASFNKESLIFLQEEAERKIPFSRIKEAYASCDSCKTGHDYANLFLSIINDHQSPNEFILYSIPTIDGYILKNEDNYKYDTNI